MIKILSNKWRPQTLSEIVGQNEAIYIIKNIIKNTRLHHSFIIHGNYGTGKTSLARIITKCFNCETGVTDNPCNKCYCCTSINNNTNYDSIEIDAASKTKIDDLKTIINLSEYKNIKNKFKTYIIDECHMLSMNSFNFLLKILEEEVKNNIYILVTTHINKIPKTIISRCINLELKNISKNNIKKRIIHILNTENYSINNILINQLIIYSDNNLRTTINTLEKLGSIKNITNSHIYSILGLSSYTRLLNIIKNIYENNLNQVLKETYYLLNKNCNINNIIKQLQLLLYKVILHKSNIHYDKQFINNNIFLYLSKNLTINIINNMYNLIQKEIQYIKYSLNDEIGFEMLIIKLFILLNN